MAIRGKRTEALRLLRQAIDAGWRQYRWTALEPLFETFRGDPDFAELIERIRSLADEQRRIAEPSAEAF